MTSFRLPWLLIGAGVGLIVLAVYLPLDENFRNVLYVSAGILMMEGEFGRQVLPRLMPISRDRELFRTIERKHYAGFLLIPRLAAWAGACMLILMTTPEIGSFWWENVASFLLLGIWLSACIFSARKAGRDVQSTD